MPAFYEDSATTFLNQPIDTIIGQLTSNAALTGFFQQLHSQTDSWRIQIGILKKSIEYIHSTVSPCHVLLEYPIPRRGKRVDVVLLMEENILILEFKCGATEYFKESITQVEDYCLDLRDFHKESHGRKIIPIVVATNAPDKPWPISDSSDHVTESWLVNANNLEKALDEISRRYNDHNSYPINPSSWNHSDYSPTPTIIEAAQVLYAGQNVQEISRCHGGIENLTRTSDAVIGAIDTARSDGQKLICFITGVPGAGKTLAGLNIVHNHKLHDGDIGIFLSGNGPLVKVLTEALARDHAIRESKTIKEARRKTSTFIQNVHKFIDAYFLDSSKTPIDKVVIFDEAQRAWDAAQSRRKFKRPFSEPEMMLKIMDRHPDWSVIVALIGNGQEINRGEAGLGEWGRTITEHFPHWRVLISPELKSGKSSNGDSLFHELPTHIQIIEDPSLHLNVNLRSYKAEALSEFVSAVLSYQPEHARQIMVKLSDYPIVMTRDLVFAKKWLKRRQRGSRRIGLIASSGARRLRAHGLDVKSELDIENWLLNPSDDIRSSYCLEVPATEFDIQGLEMDWTGVCWDGDLFPQQNQWMCRSFRGKKWQRVNNATSQQYTINKYRVLLTRAREGMIIWIPQGDQSDPTRPPKVYDTIAKYLKDCGIPTQDIQSIPQGTL